MPTDALIVRRSWFARALKAVGLLGDGKADLPAGADFFEDHPARPGYDVEQSMSAYAAFGWVYACANALSEDLSGLPIIAVEGDGKGARVLNRHPMLDLLARPSTRVGGVLFRRQMLVDLVLCGDFYAAIAGRSAPESLLRLAPQRTTILPWSDGQIGGYEHDGAGARRRLTYDEVLHVGLPSWEDDPSRLYGTGAIRPLHQDLTTDLAAAKTAAKSSQTGRPSGVLSPANKDDLWDATQVKALRESYERKFNASSGLLILGGTAKYEAMGWTPRDMEYPQLRALTRETILAVMEVPPTRVGLPNANYATAESQAERYWEGLRGRAALLDGEFTRVARMFPNSARVTIRHDFAKVAALQRARDAQLSRVSQWYSMGVPLAAAAAYEGFDDAPAAVEATPAAAQPPAPKAATKGTDSREADTAIWRRWIREVHGPAERAVLVAVKKARKAQGERMAARVLEALQAGNTPDPEAIMDRRTEDRLLHLAIEPALRAAAIKSRAFALAEMEGDDDDKALGSLFGFTPPAVEERGLAGLIVAIALRVSQMIERVQTTTESALVRTLSEAQGDPAVVAEAVQQMEELQAPHSQTIATTETTAAVSEGVKDAAEEAKEPAGPSDPGQPGQPGGTRIMKRWISERDEKVRRTHVALDSSTLGLIQVDEDFVSPSGDRGYGPGLFETAAENINCRCHLVLRRESAGATP